MRAVEVVDVDIDIDVLNNFAIAFEIQVVLLILLKQDEAIWAFALFHVLCWL